MMEQLLVVLDQVRESVRVKDGEVEELKSRFNDVENEGEQKDLKWQEMLLEFQNLKLEIEKCDQEKVEMDLCLQVSVG